MSLDIVFVLLMVFIWCCFQYMFFASFSNGFDLVSGFLDGFFDRFYMVFLLIQFLDFDGFDLGCRVSIRCYMVLEFYLNGLR